MRVAQEFLALAYTIDQSFSAATLSLYFGSRSILWQWTGTWQSLSEVTLAPGYNGRPILWQSLSPLRVDHTWRLLCTLQVAQCGDSCPRLWQSQSPYTLAVAYTLASTATTFALYFGSRSVR